jgi:8-oxo-dGTP diphosphatase
VRVAVNYFYKLHDCIRYHSGLCFVKMNKRELKTPLVTVDIVIRYQGGIVLIERKNEPAGWALPGGFVDLGESLEEAAVREAGEETSLDVALIEQFHAYSRPERDPRFHTVTVVFIGIGVGEIKGRDDARRAEVFLQNNLPETIAFDHREIVNDYFRYIATGMRPRIEN